MFYLRRNEFEVRVAGYSRGKQFKMLPGFVRSYKHVEIKRKWVGMYQSRGPVPRVQVHLCVYLEIFFLQKLFL